MAYSSTKNKDKPIISSIEPNFDDEIFVELHYENKLTKNIGLTDI